MITILYLVGTVFGLWEFRWLALLIILIIDGNMSNV